jgi:hypothetical protein
MGSAIQNLIRSSGACSIHLRPLCGLPIARMMQPAKGVAACRVMRCQARDVQIDAAAACHAYVAVCPCIRQTVRNFWAVPPKLIRTRRSAALGKDTYRETGDASLGVLLSQRPRAPQAVLTRGSLPDTLPVWTTQAGPQQRAVLANGCRAALPMRCRC